MNILYIDHYAGSPVLGMEYRPYYLARQWVREGHRVRIVAASHAHTRLRQPRVQGAIERTGFDGIEYIFLKTPAYSGHGWKRWFNIFSFVMQLYTRRDALIQNFKPDVVIASSAYPFDVAPAKAIAHASGARLVYEVTELWPDSPRQLWGMDAGHPLMRFVAWAQRQALAAADVVVSVLPRADVYLKTFGYEGPFVHVPNGIDPEEWGGEREDSGIDVMVQAVIDRFRAQGRMVVGYAGTHGDNNGLYGLIDAASHLRDAKVGFVCVGEGASRTALSDYAEERNVADFFAFCGPIAKRQVPRFLKQMDVLYMGAKPLDVYQYGVSFNKAYDYMMAGRPMVMAVNAGNDMLGEAGCGLSVPSGTGEDIAAAVRRLRDMTAPQRDAYGLEARSHVLLHNTYPVLARRFLEAVETKG